MAFTLKRFGTVTLPEADPVSDMGSFQTMETTQVVAGGQTYDTYGTDDAPTRTTVFMHQGSLLENSAADLETAYRELLALRGTTQKLYRYWPATETYEWIYARLTGISVQYSTQFLTAINLIAFTFESRSINWRGARHGADWYLDDGEYFDTGLFFDISSDYQTTVPMPAGSPLEMEIVNNGNVTVRDVTITIENLSAGAAALTAINITGPGWEIDYTGSVGAEETLIIDSKDFSVLLDGVDDYANFALGSSHAIEGWMELAPGSNTLTFTVTTIAPDHNVRFTVDFFDGWA